jgi:hypothetical protein
MRPVKARDDFADFLLIYGDELACGILNQYR